MKIKVLLYPTIIANVLLALVMFSAVGCMKTAVIHPGAINQTDSTIYDALLSAQAAIEQAKMQAGPTPSPAIKTALNTTIAAYNVAEASYKTYHSLAASGGTPDATQLQQQVAMVISDIAALVTQIKGVVK